MLLAPDLARCQKASTNIVHLHLFLKHIKHIAKVNLFPSSFTNNQSKISKSIPQTAWVERAAPWLLYTSAELFGCMKCFMISSNAALPRVTWTSRHHRQDTENGTSLQRRIDNPTNRQKAILHLQCCWPLSRLWCRNQYLGRTQPHLNFQLKLSWHQPKQTCSTQPQWWQKGASNAPISTYC